MPRLDTFNDTNNRPQIGIYSYSKSKNDKKASGQFDFNVSTIRDPAGQKQFAGLNGTHPEVRDWVAVDKRISIIIADCLILADDLIKPKGVIGSEKSACKWLSFSFSDFHGKWTAPAVAESVANALSDEGYLVAVHHQAVPKEQVFCRDLLSTQLCLP